MENSEVCGLDAALSANVSQVIFQDDDANFAVLFQREQSSYLINQAETE